MKCAVAVVGPTGSGKTALALEVAERLRTEIISADSMQFYRGMEIGCAAPSAAEQQRVHHHFVSFLNPDEDMAAGKYEGLARRRAEKLLQCNALPVLCGGSGLYINAFKDGLFPGPARDQSIRDRLRARAREEGTEALYAQLQEVDPDYAAQLTSANDLVRIVRALEVHELTGRPFSLWHQAHQHQADKWEVLQVAPDWDREVLYARINHRVQEMIDAGWVDETQRLIASGYEKDIHRLKALGYREIAAYLRGESSLEEAVEAARMHHRRYAKKQLTWFRADKGIHWLPCCPASGIAAMADQVMDLISRRFPHYGT
ncbi:MAG TPA: tRNA (adenosine(37)-N6)-dimethylallyltransferase MiaA [Candidatus Hydrogenedentes bacterium]|nr:tRNA (adenosine(37)-N6)-dimethylallyltransferase MiaA [Candidatus Hydrogenedentota bacterium]HOD94827.1 tRNA (adenosine(37)-N6)-dimethylallyltransferase MiaA [Candidatus Hydrogenedentota bacterium]HPK24775.1 tRNA (adenosine(37)-N6)-dimethylallyltransferase MiaA [Candidatus Hydrogenedentota bacterium]HPX85776.1 tRNA (adenosine(37)-N6)-dimethylallyltransferase MiaA [Candidatus Hydrogenedentota bacterium]HQB03667.1 tRNA (adenosine(37)-N6)-dimethylallyltransferase MiaA [Candidatus Hydrogenedento